MKTCNQCHTKKSERDFTKGIAVCKICRAKIIKEQRKQNNLADRNEIEEFYNEILKSRQKLFLSQEEFANLNEDPDFHAASVIDEPLIKFEKNTTWRDDIKKGLIKDVYFVNDKSGRIFGHSAVYYLWTYNPELYKEFM